MGKNRWILPVACFVLACTGFGFEKETVMVAVRDGVRLATDIYKPTARTGHFPCVLMRTPYGRGGGLDDSIVTILTDVLGYAIAIQDMRGRHGSEGVDSLYFSDGWGIRRDGFDTVEWVGRQSWSNGKVGMLGASASGITTYLAAGTRPPSLACGVALVAASNLYEDAAFYGGEFQRALVAGWLEDVGDSHFLPFFIAHHDDGPAYDRVNLTARFDSVNVPIFHAGGWHDIFTQGVLNAFVGIQENGGPGARGRQRLLMGPWVHNVESSACGELVFPASSVTSFMTEVLQWFNFWLKEESQTLDAPAVRYFIMGDADRPQGPGNRWVETDRWPPACDTVPVYLRADRALAFERPVSPESPDAFDFDPQDPVPTVGGRNLNIPAGSYDQRSVENRPDVLVYTSETIEDSIVAVGRVQVRLWASSDAFDTDFTAKLCDVYPDGRSMLVADGIVQARHRGSLSGEMLLTPGEPVEFTIDLWSTAIAFAPGHRIRLAVSSSNFPRFEVNPNTGEPFGTQSQVRVARQTVFHDAERPSALFLPILKAGSGNGEGGDWNFVLGQNYPNPFNRETVIPVLFVNSGSAGGADLDIVDALGRQVRHWRLDGGQAGPRQVRWDGTDQDSRPLPSGVYVVRLCMGSSVYTKKLVLLR